MNFEVDHVFDAPVEVVEAAMFHPDYAGFLVAQSNLLERVTMKSYEDDGATLRRQVQVAPRPSFDKIGTKKIPPEWFEFTEQSAWTRRDRRLQFENVPTEPKVARRVTNRGEVTLEILSPGKTLRRARGEIKVHNLPLLARPLIPLIEQMLVREAKRMLAAEADTLAAFLRTPFAKQAPELTV